MISTSAEATAGPRARLVRAGRQNTAPPTQSPRAARARAAPRFRREYEIGLARRVILPGCPERGEPCGATALFPPEEPTASVLSTARADARALHYEPLLALLALRVVADRLPRERDVRRAAVRAPRPGRGREATRPACPEIAPF